MWLGQGKEVVATWFVIKLWGVLYAIMRLIALEELNGSYRPHTLVDSPCITEIFTDCHNWIRIICLRLDINNTPIGGFESDESMSRAAIGKIYGNDPGFDILLCGVCHQVS
jgi:hypothetical protein